jgi:hypothetical protein
LQELDALKDRRAQLRELERDKTALLETSAGTVAPLVDELTLEERNRVYKMLQLRYVLRPVAPAGLSGSFMVGPEGRATENGRSSRSE